MKFRQTFWPSFFVFLGLLIVYLFAVNFGGEQNNMEENKFTLESPAFAQMGEIPSRFTCDSATPISPPFKISNVPAGTVSMVLLMDDPDIPESVKAERGIDVFDHWVVYGITPDMTEINEGIEASSAWATEGLNSAGSSGYRGPCPPDGRHRYFFKLYALNGDLSFVKAPTKQEVVEAMQPMIISEAELIGTYERQ